MAHERVGSVGKEAGDGRTVDGAFRPVGELIGGEPAPAIVGSAGAEAEDVAVGVRDGRIEGGVRHGWFSL